MIKQRKFRRRISDTGRKADDVVQTHCGFREQVNPIHGYMSTVSRACDDFFARIGMTWVAQIQDYLPDGEAFEIISALSQNR